MTINPSDRVRGQVHRLFNVGVFGTSSDAQLVDRFVSRRDEAAEAAFEELVIRHGPMLLRVCRSVLHDAHDADDAFQAVFLLLASRARAIRAGGSVASWLFGVAQRVASRGKRSTSRRQRLQQLVAERTLEGYLSAEDDSDSEILHEEVNGLPERLRAPVVLRDKREIQTIESPCAWITALGFAPDGKRVAAGLLDTSIVLWDVRPAD